MRKLDRHESGDERESLRWEDERVRSQSDEPGRDFEQEVSDINTDPDAGFDFDLNPTDEKDPTRSER
jgi:hypothetical protein